MTLPPDADPGQPLSPPMHSKGPQDDAAVPDTFPVVGIGASAGGLEALTRLLPTLPTDVGMAYLLVLHLDPNRESHLSEILGRSTAMPVREAQHHQRIEPNVVYTIPPNVAMAVGGGLLHLVPRDEVQAPHLPVEFLFRSMSEDMQSRAIGMVLSGTGTDGTQGICEIKAVGGITFAQTEETAQFGGMPHSAIDSGCVDFVLPPEEIGPRLASVGVHPYLATHGRAASPTPLEFDGFYGTVLDVVERATGVDFSQYRDSTIRRRIMRRMAVHGDRKLVDYVTRLEGDDREAEGLYHDLLINVTSFFRDAELFEALKVQVFPELTKGKSPTTPLRVWVPGCSTGQEAYSLAITMLEYFDDKPYRPPIQIFATDLAENTALDRARQGVFPESIEGEVSPERLRRFFRKDGHSYHIEKSIRELCVFAQHNVTADPPFSHLDLISCRNVLIYLGTTLQRRVIPTFHYALNLPGYLVLGTAETVGEAGGEMFSITDREHKIYVKRPVTTRPPTLYRSNDFRAPAAGPGRRAVASMPAPPDFQREVDRILLGRYSPPAVLVNRYFDIMQFRGKTGDYLESPPGEPTLNALKMAREGLFLELRSALAEAEKNGLPVRRADVRVRRDGQSVELDLEVLPVRSSGSGDQCFLVIFHEDDSTLPRAAEPLPQLEPELAARELAHIRQELAATREYMQSLLEEQDILNEELRGTNAEILSSNEELQSTNEELETAKEELQSTNEELTTVNEQLQHRNVELSQANADFANLLASLNLPVVMVGGDLRVRRFTSPAIRALGMQPSDVGRPLGYLRLSLPIDDLEALVSNVIRSGQAIEREVRDADGRWQLLRVHPYRAADERTDGAVVVMVDIDLQKHAEELLRDADRRKDEFLAMLAHELRNPLAPLRQAADIIRLAADDQHAVGEAREVLDRQVRQLTGIISDLVDVSRITEKKIQLRREVVSVRSILNTAVETSRSLLEGMDHRLTLQVPSEPLYVDADPVRMAQVLINLLNNAAKYSDRNGHITVTVERSHSPKDSALGHVEVHVRDTGIGISPELLPSVFDMFIQGDRTLERSRGGLGVGLTVARSIVEMHGGRIEAKSEGKGQGTELCVSLPLVDPAGATVQPRAHAMPTRGGVKHPRRILVVDDGEDQARSLGTLLELMGHTVRIAMDGPEALAAAEEFQPEVALIDIGLPGINGFEVARRIRAHPRLRDILLIAQTGWGQEADRRHSHAAGFDEHLVKPVDLADLNELLDRDTLREVSPLPEDIPKH